jgi:hypothetical protein
VAVPTLSIQTASIVLRGQFNPAILSPGWLLAEGLLGPKEALDVRSQVILNQLSTFHTSWLQCQVTEDQLVASTDEPPEFERLRDVLVGILKTLPHTPVSAMGINRTFHFQMPSWEDWHALGDTLAPKTFWDEFLQLPGTETVSIQGNRPDEFAGRVLVTVQPSRTVKTGIFVMVNDHYVLQKVQNQPSTRSDARLAEDPLFVEPSAERIPLVVEILTEKWLNSLDWAEALAMKIATL